MDLSPLLTKKALIAGGGTTAATTAIVVPVAVTQSGGSNETIEGKESGKDEKGKKVEPSSGKPSSQDKGKKVNKDNKPNQDKPESKEEKKIPAAPVKIAKLYRPVTTTSLTLDSSLIQSFNKPGDCVKRTFPGIETEIKSDKENGKGFFFRPEQLSEGITHHHTLINFASEFAQAKNPNFDYACLTFIKPNEGDKEFRLEVTFKRAGWGWLWMSGAKKIENEDTKYEFYYKEAALKYEANKWNIKMGVDGKFERTEQDIIPKFNSKAFKDIPSVDAKECDSKGENCESRKLKTMLWLPMGNSSPIFPEEETWSKSILALSGDRTVDYNGNHSKNQRSGIFVNGKWYSSNANQQETVKFRNSDQKYKKGTWKNLIEFCENNGNLSKHRTIYSELCL